MSRRATIGAATALVAAVLVGCGVPTDDGARRIPDRDVPFDLLSPTPPTTSSP